jgi:hypothetical protein
MRLALSAAALVVVAASCLGQMTAGVQVVRKRVTKKVVIANTIYLRDGKDQILAVFGDGGPGRHTFAFLGRRAQLHLTTEKGSPRVVFDENSVRAPLDLGLLHDANPRLLTDGGSNGKLHLGILGRQTASMLVGGDKGRTIIALVASPSPGDGGAVSLYDRAGKSRVTASVAARAAFMALLDDSERTRTLCGSATRTEVEFNFYDALRRTRLRMTQETDGAPLIKFSDPQSGESRVFK